MDLERDVIEVDQNPSAPPLGPERDEIRQPQVPFGAGLPRPDREPEAAW